MKTLGPLGVSRGALVLLSLSVLGYYVFLQTEPKQCVKPREFDASRQARKGGFADITDAGTSGIHRQPNGTGPAEPGAGEPPPARRSVDLHGMAPRDIEDRTVLVTAVSQNHLREAEGMVASAQAFLPRTRIVMYNLGLSPAGVREVQRLCNVELRQFDFSRHPPHVRDLHKYAWKPLIIKDTLDEFGIIFWCDASARFTRDPLVLFSLLEEQSGFMRRIVEFRPNKILARTHPQMFRELGVDRAAFAAADDGGGAMCFEANRLLMANSALIRERIVLPWVDCALNEACISPSGSTLSLNRKGPARYTHRFDQAALALVAYKNMRGVWTPVNDRSKLFHEVVGLSRTNSGANRVKFCDSPNSDLPIS